MEGTTNKIRQQARIQAHVWVSGRVQGIFFRASAKVEAGKRNISGWVQNLPDGRVELVAQGKKKEVEDFIDWCKRGPILAHIGRVDISFEPLTSDLKGFELREYVSGLIYAVKNSLNPK